VLFVFLPFKSSILSTDAVIVILLNSLFFFVFPSTDKIITFAGLSPNIPVKKESSFIEEYLEKDG